MQYEDQVAIGANVTTAVSDTLREYGVLDQQDTALVGALAQAVLIAIDRAGYEIVKK